MALMFYYKMRDVLLQNAIALLLQLWQKFITKWVDFSTNYDK